MSGVMRKRLARIEKKVCVGQVAPGERDSRLVDLLRYVHRDAFRPEMVPAGLSFEAYWAEVERGIKAAGGGRLPIAHRVAA